MMHAEIRRMVSDLDTETKAMIKAPKSLALLGDRDSRYLQAVARRAIGMGIPVVWGDTLTGISSEQLKRLGLVWDIAYPKYAGLFEQGRQAGCADFDSIKTQGQSSCSLACDLIVSALKPRTWTPHDKLVVITGRGHAQKGLSESLRSQGYTLTCVHHNSSDRMIRLAASNAEVLINTSPYIHWPFDGQNRLVLDVSGSLGWRTPPLGYVGSAAIGALTVSVLLNRYARSLGGDAT